MKKPKGVAVMRIMIKPKKGGSDDSPVDDDPDDDYDGPQDDESGHGEGMKEAMKLIQSLLGGGDELDKSSDAPRWDGQIICPECEKPMDPDPRSMDDPHGVCETCAMLEYGRDLDALQGD